MNEPNPADEIEFTCNICESKNRILRGKFHRELAPCSGCGSNARFRGVIYALSLGLYKESRDLKHFDKDRNVKGVGMSDWEGYASILRKKFNYRNTFYDKPPALDINNPAWNEYHDLDFVISTDVFEHILAPVQPAFDNVYKLLRPGGVFVFTVPYIHMENTVEHFAGLADYKIFDFDGDKILVSRSAEGGYDVYSDLIFHGGEGATLEMRIFSKDDILKHLDMAGFSSVQVLEEPVMSIGYYWPPLPERQHLPPFLGHIILALKPA
ncbi:MAG: class I SAM-dependent methyltransferase [Chromatiaceae bacterium]|nr:class I SAM-dependent methyltransferase [Chromatiaceae bacterium]MCF7993343.1 class I SAM-dependent methyltransferase [Chromatiaceae bacterium]MCF8014857.1 class I SAM-dependent methyltransferase [Chromatiaceae bacterium]